MRSETLSRHGRLDPARTTGRAAASLPQGIRFRYPALHERQDLARVNAGLLKAVVYDLKLYLGAASLAVAERMRGRAAIFL